MKTNRFFKLLGVFLLATVCIVMVNQGVSLAKTASLIRIEPVETEDGKLVGFNIDPKVLKVDEGAVVIWQSGIPEMEVRVIFEDGKVCMELTTGPSGFALDNYTNCFVTTYMPYGATSILQFPKAGTFDYLIMSEDAKLKFKGQIVVH